ncbi:BglII/BstYI family type II restriction endonuclease [Priestia megaterium]|uniref:BglII/BstYI family type II restriction endonuclease n=1 Tax=Priestia megaterium TaxID=1404 RepID=UPI000BFA96AD|nr:BglII/BstYI family type II restriction endonuclease [Priestia megaterium]PFJ00302.1 restriction endonuclease [Priestia megaterium]PGR16744.1 restriction endonuclease [Priestia megaterium]
MSIDLLPPHIRDKFEVHEWRHACAILKEDFPKEWNDIISVLNNFTLNKSDIVTAGGRKSPISTKIDNFLYDLKWEEKSFDTKIMIDGVTHETPTHKIDCLKNRIALEIEWNNKDPFFDRDLNNFRLLFELDAISVGVIITRCTELQVLFNSLGKGSSYGNSTTHMSKLIPRIEGGGGGGCPILVFGISDKSYREDI